MRGGLDSTSLAAVVQDLLRNVRGSSDHACTNVYDKLFDDEERHYSTLVAKALGIPIVHLPADAYSLFDGDAADDLNQPETFLISLLAAKLNGLVRQLAQNSRVELNVYDG